MDASAFKIEKLRDAENWQQWRFVVETLLDNDDLLGVCDGTVPIPVKEDEKAAWNKANKDAKKLIVTTIESKPLQLIMGCKNAAEMWKKLHSIYDLKSEESLSLTQKQFFDFQWNVSENVATNISNVQQIASKIKSLGSDVTDSMLISRILSTLPQEYAHFHSAWESTAGAKRTIDNLLTRLMTEEVRLQRSATTSESETQALLSKSKVNKPGAKMSSDKRYNYDKRYNDSKFKKRGCFNCGKPDHMQKDCPGCFKCGGKNHIARNCYVSEDRKSEYRANNDRREKEFKQPQKQAFMVRVDEKYSEEHWLIDSGASDHMTSRGDWFTEYKQFGTPTTIRVGNGAVVSALGRGNIDVQMHVRGRWYDARLYDVLYAPGLNQNLFSVKMTAKKGIDMAVTNRGKMCTFYRNGNIVATGLEIGELYRIDMRVVLPKNANVASAVDTLQLWHERLAHQNKKHVKSFLKNLNINVEVDNEFCDACAYGKQHRTMFGKNTARAKEPREKIYSDVCGPKGVDSLGKRRYYVVFKNDFTNYRTVYFLKNKSEVKLKIEHYCNEIRTQFGRDIKELVTDGGREYIDKDVNEFLSKRGIKHTVTVPYTPEQNGIAERENRIVMEAARSVLYAQNNMPEFLWAEAINYVVHVLNRSGPTKVENKTPYELWHGNSIDVKYFKVFGTECFVHIPKEKRRKLDRKAMKGYLVGYLENLKGYRVYVPEKRDVKITRDVQFKSEKLSTAYIEIETISPEREPLIVSREIETISPKREPLNVSRESIYDDAEYLQVDTEDNNEKTRTLRDRTKVRKPSWYGSPCANIAEVVPRNYNEAINSKESKNWIIAMNDELNSLKDSNTWQLVDKPKNAKVLGNRWVFRKKECDENVKYKARLVIKGCSQREGIDYIETFSPVVRYDTLRIILSVAASSKLKMRQFDVKTAFLYSPLKEEIFMSQPEGFENGTNKVCKLIKSIYGLKQAPRCWGKHFEKFLKDCNLKESKADPCLYYRKKRDKILIIALWVDDGLVLGSCEKEIDEFLCTLSNKFEVTIFENVRMFVGMEMYRLSDDMIFVSQETYARKIIERFNMSDAKEVKIPIEHEWDAYDSKDTDSSVPYREAVGNLMFLQVVSRPDIAFALNVASRALDKPTKAHWNLVKRIIRYVKGTANYGIVYGANNQFKTFSDADYAGDKETRKSTTGVVCMYGGAAISWQSKKQQCVAVSTTEAEYVSAAAAARENVWVMRLLRELDVNVSENILYIDNQSALKLVKNPEFHQRSKHIDVKYHFVRDLYERGEINVCYVRTEEQLADIFTKVLNVKRFEFLRSKLGIISKNDVCIEN